MSEDVGVGDSGGAKAAGEGANAVAQDATAFPPEAISGVAASENLPVFPGAGSAAPSFGEIAGADMADAGAFPAEAMRGVAAQEGLNVAPGVAAPDAIASPAAMTPSVGGAAPLSPMGGGLGAGGDESLPGTVSSPPGGPGNIATNALKTLGIYDNGKIGANALPLGGLALSQLNANKTGKSLQDQLAKAGELSGGAAKQLVGQGLAGTPNAGQSHDIDEWLNGQMNQIAQRYAAMGRDAKNDSSAQKEMADAQAKAVAMRDQAAQGVLSQGLSAAGLAQGPATEAAIAGAKEDHELQSAMASTMQNMALLQALQRGQA